MEPSAAARPSPPRMIVATPRAVFQNGGRGGTAAGPGGAGGRIGGPPGEPTGPPDRPPPAAPGGVAKGGLGVLPVVFKPPRAEALGDNQEYTRWRIWRPAARPGASPSQPPPTQYDAISGKFKPAADRALGRHPRPGRSGRHLLDPGGARKTASGAQARGRPGRRRQPGRDR